MKNLKRHKKQIAIAVAFIVLLIVFQTRNKQDETIATTVVKQGNLEETLTISGEIAADRVATLSFQTGGRLSYVGVSEGQKIERGTTVASLDTRSVKKNLQKELNDYAKSRNDFDQSRDDNKTILNDTIKRTLEDAQYDLNNAVLDVELQDLAREYSFLTSPISGIVTKVNPSTPGVNITATTASYEVVDPTSVYFSASVDQSEVSQIKEGDSANVIIDSFPDNELSATVKSISFAPKTDETGTVYEVKLIFDQFDNSLLRLGMTGDVEFILNQVDNALHIPILYLKEDESGKQYVNIIKNGKIEKRIVDTGIESEDSIQIKKGLSVGDVVSE